MTGQWPQADSLAPARDPGRMSVHSLQCPTGIYTAARATGCATPAAPLRTGLRPWTLALMGTWMPRCSKSCTQTLHPGKEATQGRQEGLRGRGSRREAPPPRGLATPQMVQMQNTSAQWAWPSPHPPDQVRWGVTQQMSPRDTPKGKEEKFSCFRMGEELRWRVQARAPWLLFSCPVLSDSLRPHGIYHTLQHTELP